MHELGWVNIDIQLSLQNIGLVFFKMSAVLQVALLNFRCAVGVHFVSNSVIVYQFFQI